MPYGVVWLWTWVPAAVATCALVAAPIIGIWLGDWQIAGGFCLIGLFGVAISIGSYFLFWRGRNSK
jgi:hypothetical protein